MTLPSTVAWIVMLHSSSYALGEALYKKVSNVKHEGNGQPSGEKV